MGNVNQIFNNAAISTGGDYKLSTIFDPFKENSGKLTLNITTQTKSEYYKLSNWQQLFITNFYTSQIHKPYKKTTKIKEIENDINRELNRLYNLSSDKDFFEIDIENNPFLERELVGELNALKKRGNEADAKYIEGNKTKYLEKIANNFSASQFAEYNHIVSILKSSNYEPAFKALILRETLMHTYKQVKINGEEKVICEKRVPNKTVAGHMTFNSQILEHIYKNVNKHKKFSTLYFEAVSEAKKIWAREGKIDLNINTFGKGKWLKFNGIRSDEKNYMKNAQNLSALVKNTPWCTKELASTQLTQGDFYVFVDNKNEPHIAVKMAGNEIDEVRGIKNGNSQELEEEYRPVAVEFLTKNKYIKNGDAWLKKEEWNDRLINWASKVNTKSLTADEVPLLLKDLRDEQDFKSHGENSNLTNLKLSLSKQVPDAFGKFFDCAPEEIQVEVVEDEILPYYKKHILCDGIFYGSDIPLLSNLHSIGGSADFRHSRIIDVCALHSIGGYARFEHSILHSLNNLHSIGGSAYFQLSNIKNLCELEYIGGNAYFANSKIASLDKLKYIGGNVYFEDSFILDIGELEEVGESAYFKDSLITCLNNLKKIGGSANFEKSIVESLGNLEKIGKNASFSKSKIVDLGNLKIIGGHACFQDSEITDLKNLKYIGGNAYFEDSHINNLANLEVIGGNANFNKKIKDFGKLKEINGNVYIPFENIVLREKLKKEFMFDAENKTYYRHPEFLAEKPSKFKKENSQEF